MSINKKASMSRRKKAGKKVVKMEVSQEELLEALDDLFLYFDLTEDSYSEPAYMTLHDGQKFVMGIVDSELHDILMRVYGLVKHED